MNKQLELNLIKYTETDILNAVGVISPNLKRAIDSSVYMSTPVLLNHVLLEYFVQREMNKISDEYNKAGQMLLKAYNDLGEHGHFLYEPE